MSTPNASNKAMNCCKAEINVNSPKAIPAVLSPTAPQASQPLTVEIQIQDEVRSPTNEKDIETKTTSPIATPLSHALSTLSHLSPMKHTASPYASPRTAPPRNNPTVHPNTTNQTNESDLIAYSEHQASKLSYPVGCPVWYSYDNDESTSKTSTTSTTASSSLTKVKYGTVASAYMNVTTRSFVYKIHNTNKDDKDEHFDDLVPEHQMAYATGCPVRIKKDDTVFLDGEIICVSKLQDSTGSSTIAAGSTFVREDAGCNNTYSVMLKGGRNELMIEHNVGDDRIKYRGDDDDLVADDKNVARAVGEDAICNGFKCW